MSRKGQGPGHRMVVDWPWRSGRAVPRWSHVEQVSGDRGGLRERDEVTARQHVRLDAEPFAGHPALESGGEEPVVRAGHDPDRYGRPAGEVTHRPEHRGGLGPLVRL